MIGDIRQTTYKDILSLYDSAIAFDIAPRHTGIALWERGKLTTSGFVLDYHKSDKHGLEKMRRQLAKFCVEHWGRDLEKGLCVVEDVYGGSNFKTVQQLCLLNTVIDGCILDGEIKVKDFKRLSASEWRKGLRLYAKNTLLTPKEETAYILRELGVEIEKGDYLEDRQDAVGMLLGSIGSQLVTRRGVNRKSQKLVLKSYVSKEKVYKSRHKRVKEGVGYEFGGLGWKFRGQLEDEILMCLRELPENAYGVWEVPIGAYGVTGLKYGLTYTGETGYVLGYLC